MKLLTTELFDKLASEATLSPRKRKNFNFHKQDETVQRFLNVMQPDTYVTPHKHQGADNFEFYCLLQGAIGVLVFNELGEVVDKVKLSATGKTRGFELAGDTYHTVVCLERDTVVLEAKEGPYDPHAMKFPLPGFPDELAFLQAGAQSDEGKKVREVIEHWKSLFR